MDKKTVLCGIGVGLFMANSMATNLKNLEYPVGGVLADDVINQTYFVNHFYGFENYGISKDKRVATALILRPSGSRPMTMTLERYLNNNYDDGVVQAKDLAIFRSGKLKGTGMLITDFVDRSKSQTYEIFIPSIRKVRRFAQPAMDDAWGGSDFTFGDVTLRKPEHEDHTMLDSGKMSGCLNVMNLPKNHRNKYTMSADIKKDCTVSDRDVYQIKSVPKENGWWYDHRISKIDKERFVDYETEYFKNGKKVKTIWRSWVNAGLADPRTNYWGYWYGKTHTTGHETMAFIPAGITKINHKYKKRNLWSTSTLRKMPRRIR